MLEPAARVIFIGFGVVWMATMLSFAVRRPAIRPLAIASAAMPGFQLGWIALVNEKTPLMYVPGLGVPVAASAYLFFAALRRRREQAAPRATPES